MRVYTIYLEGNIKDELKIIFTPKILDKNQFCLKGFTDQFCPFKYIKCINFTLILHVLQPHSSCQRSLHLIIFSIPPSLSSVNPSGDIPPIFLLLPSHLKPQPLPPPYFPRSPSDHFLVKHTAYSSKIYI